MEKITWFSIYHAVLLKIDDTVHFQMNFWSHDPLQPWSFHTAVSELGSSWRGSDFVGFHGWDFPSVSSYLRKVVVRHEDVEPAPDVHKVDQDNAINRINLYPLDSAIGFPNTYHALDSDLSGG